MPRRIAWTRWFGVGVGLVVIGAWVVFLRTRFAELQHYPWHVAPLAISVALLWSLLYFVGLALCWALLLQRVMPPHSRVPLFLAARIWLLSTATRYVPGNLWHILARVALAQQSGIAAPAVLVSSTIEQLVVLIAALVVWALALPFTPHAPGAHGWLLLLAPVGLLALHPRVFGTLLRHVAVRFKRPELAWHYTYRELLLLVSAYIAPTLSAGLALYAVLWGMTSVQLAQAPLVIGAAALAWLLGYLSFWTPSGLGVREAVLVALLAQLYPLPVALVTSLIFRLVLTGGECSAVLLAWGCGPLFRHKLHNRNDAPA